MRRALARTILAGCALGMAATLTGCSASTTVHTTAGRSIVVSAQHSSAQEEALAEGTVSWGEGGCMMIEVGQVNETHLIVFPHGTTMRDQEVILPQGYRMQAGDAVALGGGFHSADNAKSDLSAVPDACLTEEVFWASGEAVD